MRNWLRDQWLTATVWLIYTMLTGWLGIRFAKVGEAPPSVVGVLLLLWLAGGWLLWLVLSHVEVRIRRYRVKRAGQRLVESLKSHATEYSNVKIQFADMRDSPIADHLGRMFQSAGWKTNLANVPLDDYVGAYFEGVEIRGVNAPLVEALARALQRAGFAAVKTTVLDSQIGRDNPKWDSVQHGIRITVGHQPS